MTPSEPRVSIGPSPKPRARWRRELHILKRDGLRKWWRGLRALRRFHRSVEAMMERAEGGHDA